MYKIDIRDFVKCIYKFVNVSFFFFLKEINKYIKKNYLDIMYVINDF